jgi:hypothetical protein
MSLLHEVLYFFIISFISLPLLIEKVFLYFLHSDVLEPPLIHSALEEESISSSCVVDTNLVPSPLPIHEDEIYVTPPPEVKHLCSHEEVENNSQSFRTLLPTVIPIEPPQPLAESNDQPTTFQIKIRNKFFKPLRLPCHLNPYPHDSFEYIPRFFGEEHVTAERHTKAFENFIDQFEIVHEDVVMRFFSHSLSEDVVLWFRCMELGSIGSWTELYHAFLKCCDENKSLDQYWSDFNSLRRGEDEALVVFNMRFYSVYHNMLVEIRPTKTSSMVYYIMAQHLELVFLLRERKSSSLIHLFEDAIEVEESIRSRRWVHKQANVHIQEEEDYQSISNSEQGYINYGSDLEQEPGSRYDSQMESVPSSFADFYGGRDAHLYDDHFSYHFEHGAVVGCINSCMLLTDQSYFDLNPISPLIDDHFSGGKDAAADDQDLFSDEGEGDSFVCREFFFRRVSWSSKEAKIMSYFP